MRHAHSLALTAVLLLSALSAASAAPPDPTADERDRVTAVDVHPADTIAIQAPSSYVVHLDVASETVRIAVLNAFAIHDHVLEVRGVHRRQSSPERALLVSMLPRSHPSRHYATSHLMRGPVRGVGHRSFGASRVLSG